jgi:protein-L-isoaspartate(D-aspartate) O-methyltransferase
VQGEKADLTRKLTARTFRDQPPGSSNPVRFSNPLSATLSAFLRIHHGTGGGAAWRKWTPGTRRKSVPNDPNLELRAAMVETQLRKRGVKDERVLSAMGAVARHEFVREQLRGQAYSDEPLGIGGGQTISQPYIVAAMSEALQLRGSERVLEIGTGCGYQAAVLSLLSREVYSIECRVELARSAAERLERLGFKNVHVHCGDGTMGLKEFAPYDAILVAAAAPSPPEPLLEQLTEGGRMIAPVGTEEHQELLLLTRNGNGYSSERRGACRFVPLLGRHGWKNWELL